MSEQYKQKNIRIGDKVLIEIDYNNLKYYPISYTYKNILLKSKQQASKLIKDGYEVQQFKIDFGYGTGGVQKSQCISKEGFMDLLKKSNVGGFGVEQKKGMNLLLDYFNMELINEYPRFLDYFDYVNSDKYDEFEKDCIEETLKLDNSLKWQLCKDCEKYYPLHTNFFANNKRDSLMRTVCRNCINTDIRHRIRHPDNYLNNIYNKYSEEIYVLHRDNDIVGIYNHYIQNNLKSMPKILNNKESYLKIIEYLYDNKKLNKDNITFSLLINKYKLKSISCYLSSDEVYNYLFGDHPRRYPWIYKKFSLTNPTYFEIIIIFNNYLDEHNIKIVDIYNFDYYNIIKKSGLAGCYGGDSLRFVMNYYDNKHPAYKFNIASVNYWKEKENRIRALKYLIEEDMRLELEKIPLYLTITSIRNIGTTTMYTVLKNYYSGIFEWVNEVYPDVFDPKDFDINYMRNEFDSIDENTIDDILRDNFDNVLYNPKHNKHTIKLLGKIPDWFIFNTTGVTIVEYFGLWAKKRGMYNSRTRDYIISSKDKIEKYKTLQGYRFLYIYPEDLDNNYEGLHKKIEVIKDGKSLMKIV